jgi:ribose 1,5-bisphosphokinase
MSRLFYVVGASGSGKDSILREFKKNYSSIDCPIVVAHRYTTRNKDYTEESIFLSDNDFSLRKEHQLFSLDWQANGYRYALGVEVDQWLASDLSVIVNGSRAYWPNVADKYRTSLYTIAIDVPEELLCQRLQERKRESEQEILTRLERHQQLKDSFQADSTINNIGSLDTAVRKLCQIMMTQTNNQ